MDLTASIANLATNMSQTNLQQKIGTSVLKKSMDTSSQLANGMLQMLDNSSAQAFGGDVGAMFDARA